VKLTADVLGALRAARTEGKLLYLPARLDSGLYKLVDAALTEAGGRWDKVKQAHAFPGQAAIAVAGLCALPDVPTAKERTQATQFYPTPAEVTEQLITLGALGPGHQVLEPSAGTGAIAEAAAQIAAAVDCIELDAGNAAEIRSGGYARTVTVQDFLTVPPVPRYDRVLMNPPFAGGADVRHVRHALGFVKPGGRLVAVMSPGVTFHKSQAARKLRALVEASGGWFEEQPPGSFAGAGVSAETVLAVVPVPGGPAVTTEVPGVGTVTRVTTDATGWHYPWFRPAAAAPGVYAHDSFGGAGRVFRFTGNCTGCGARTWAHDDGHDDARGPFGANTCTWLLREEFPGDSDVSDDARFPRCWPCSQDDDLNQAARAGALALLRDAQDEQDRPRTADERPAQPGLFPGLTPVPAPAEPAAARTAPRPAAADRPAVQLALFGAAPA
jgi:predicted RNA methylase